jgi:hypothetical protein
MKPHSPLDISVHFYRLSPASLLPLSDKKKTYICYPLLAAFYTANKFIRKPLVYLDLFRFDKGYFKMEIILVTSHISPTTIPLLGTKSAKTVSPLHS